MCELERILIYNFTTRTENGEAKKRHKTIFVECSWMCDMHDLFVDFIDSCTHAQNELKKYTLNHFDITKAATN